MKRRDFLSAAVLVAATIPASAHDVGKPHVHRTANGTVPKTGANGGPITVADDHPIEMVASDTELSFFVQDEDGKPLDTKGVTGRAVVTQGGKNATVQLAAAAPNKLTGALPTPLAAGAKVIMSAKVHGHNLQARFEKK